MPRKRPRATTFVETMAALPQARYRYGEGVPSPAGREEFVDEEGNRWRKVRGPLHRALTKRLVTQADALIIGVGAGGRLRQVLPEDRPATWKKIKDRLHANEAPGYHPYEFASSDGLTLLYVEESC